jgi:hypothetical protein
VSDFLVVGNYVSVRGSAAVGEVLSASMDTSIGGSLSIAGESLMFGDFFNCYVNGMRLISGDAGLRGHLHGQWTVDTAVTTSDRRFKRQIVPLNTADGGPYNVLDILENLRPVSFVLDGDDRVRFGFIAQELERILPSIVVDGTDDASSTKSVLYQDLIAVLTSVIQNQQDQLNSFTRRMKLMIETRMQQEEEMKNLQLRLAKLETILENLAHEKLQNKP